MINSYSLLKIYKSSPFPGLILLPDAPKFTIVEVTSSFASLLSSKNSEIIGNGIFEVLSQENGMQNKRSDFHLMDSLKTVIQDNKPNKASDKHIAIDQSIYEDYNYENIPVLAVSGEIEYIIHTVTVASKNRSNQDALLNCTEDLMWSIDSNYRIITANDPFRRMMRLETGQVVNEGDSLLHEKFGDDVNDKWRTYYQRALAGEKFSVKEHAYSVRRQEIEHMLISLTPMYDAEGKVWGAACYAKDVTEETQNLSELEDAKAELSKIMDSSLDIICTINAEGKFINLSAATKKMLGYYPAELQGKSFIDYVVPDDRIRTLQAAEDILVGIEMTNLENRYIRKDGDIIPLVWSVRYDEVDELAYCIAKDATEKKKSELDMWLMIHNTDEAFLLVDQALHIVSFNEKFEYLYKRHFNKEVKKGTYIIDYAQPERRTTVKSIYANVLAGGEETAELTLPLPDNSLRTFLARYKPALDEHDNIIGVFLTFKDITEANAVKQQLQASEEKYRLLFYNSPLPKWIYDIETYKILEVNETAIKHYGYSRKEFCEMTIKDLRPKKEIPNLIAHHKNIRKNNTNYFETHLHTKKDKSNITVEVTGYRMEYQGRNCMVVDINDVTEKERTLQHLKDNEDKLLTAQRIAMMGYWQFQIEGKSLYWSDEVYNIWGVKKDEYEVDFRNFFDTINQRDHDGFAAEKEAVMKGEKNLDLVYRIKTPDGAEKWIHATGELIRNPQGKPIVLEGTVQDITAKKWLELSLEESNRRYEYVMRATFDAIWDWDLITDKVYWGGGFCEIFGYDLETLKPDLSSWIEHIHPEDFERIDKDINSLIDGDKLYWANEYRFRKSDKTYAHVSDRGYVIRDNNGNGLRMVGAMQDITKSKEEALQKELVAEISVLFGLDLTLEATLQEVLKKLLVCGKFCLAEAWLTTLDQRKIELIAKTSESQEIEAFYEDTLNIKSFKKGEGLPGNIWQLRRMQDWTDISKNKKIVRKSASETAGIHAVCGFPLIFKEEVIGVIILGLKKDDYSYMNLTSLFDNLSGYLSSEIRRKQLELDLTQIFSFSPDIICIAGVDGYLKKINPAMCRLLEYSEEELLAIPFRNFIHPDDKAKTANEIYNLSIGLSTQYFENRLICKSGKVKWLAWTASPSKEISLFFSVAKDITEKKKLEELLEKANQLSKIGSWEFDLKTNTVFWSSVTKVIHEVDDTFSPDISSAMAFYKEGLSRTTIKKAIEKAIGDAVSDGVVWDLELSIVTAKGNDKWVRSIGKVEIQNGEVSRMYGSFQDIDAQKKSEEALRLSHERYSIVSKATNDSIWDWDLLKNEVIRPGKTLEGLLGYENIEPSLVDDFWQKHVQTDDWNRLTKQRNALFESSDENYWEDEYLFLRADGKYATIYDRGYILRDENGKATRMIGASRDISKLKENEIQLKNMNKQLEKQAKNLTISNSELEQFAYIASHDLQEPLRMITSFLSQIEKKYGSVLDERGKQYIHFAVDGAQRMRQIILDLLEFSRVGRLDEEPVEVNLNEVLNGVLSLYRKRIKETNAKIEVVNMPVINSYKAPIRQVIQNLFSNALKYHKKDVPPFVKISFEESLNHWQFSVEDNGIGIDHEYFNKIFIIFQRLHNKDDYSGTGIGLAIVKKIVESLGGEIWIASEEGKGSVFYFTIAKHLNS